MTSTIGLQFEDPRLSQLRLKGSVLKFATFDQVSAAITLRCGEFRLASGPRCRQTATMAWLNYHHLLYFWTVARAGTIAAASKELHLSQPTISSQLKTLEDALGERLFQKHGRRLALTDVGRTTYRYADDIFRLGRELQEAVSTERRSQQTPSARRA